MRAPEVYSFGTFPVYDRVLLTIVIVLHVGSLELIPPTELYLCAL